MILVMDFEIRIESDGASILRSKATAKDKSPALRYLSVGVYPPFVWQVWRAFTP